VSLTDVIVKTMVLLLLGLLVVSTARIEGRMASAGTRTEEMHDVSTLTFTKTTPDGTVITLTVTQQQGETTEAFHIRARREWAAFCAANGG